jgi:E3 ubiquitin-protein ligase RNF115/126
MEGSQELNNDELSNDEQINNVENANVQQPFDPLSSNNETIDMEENNNQIDHINESESINQSENNTIVSTPINLLLNQLINTRQQQDLHSIQDNINEPINPFLRMIHRSIQLIPEQIIINDISNILNESFNSEEKKIKPTKKEFIESLEIKTIQEEDSDKTCSICFDNLNVGEKYICLPCNDDHCFHIESCENCEGIKPWLVENNTCPVCRFELPLEEQEQEQEQETNDIEQEQETNDIEQEQEQETNDIEQEQEQETNDIQVDNREIHDNTQIITTEFDIELSQQDRQRIFELINERFREMTTPPFNFETNYIDEDGFSNMDIDEAIRLSLES